MEFVRYIDVGFIFSSDLRHVLLKKVDGKLDFISRESNSDKFGGVSLSKYIDNELSIKLKAGDWIIVTSLPHIEKLYKKRIYRTMFDFSKMTIDDNKYQIVKIDDLPANCKPNLKWLIPLCLDLCVISSNYNQILIRE